MRLLGVSAGAADGSAEILLKAALMEAEALGHEVALVRLDDLRIPTGPFVTDEPDDCPWFWEQVMASDGVIYSAPIYSRTIPGKLRLLTDRVFGPNADVGFIRLLLEREQAGDPVAVPFTPDERALRDRVVGFIAVGGSLTDQWKTLALPMMQSLAFSMRDGVVDQIVLDGAGTPQSIVLDPAALDRARSLGRNVAQQLGRRFEDVEYRGEPGLCPFCHLNVIDLRGQSAECASCGAQGTVHIDDGRVSVAFAASGLAKSVISPDEKRAHSVEILETAARHAARGAEILALAEPFVAWERRVHPSEAAVQKT
ncbi:MAG: flavodoxin family protein [Solirubrobacteraceae bacterium]